MATMSAMYDARIRMKRDTAANWTSHDPVLLDGEIIIVDTGSGETRFKIGNGTSKYTQLPFEDERVRALITSSKTMVGINPDFSDGIKIATIEVDGENTDLYTPEYTAGTGISISDDYVISNTLDLSPYATKTNPALTGTPTAPTADANNNSTQIATTAYADRAATNAANSLKDSLTSGTTTIIVKEAEHATNADNATTATTASGLNATGIAQVQDIKVNSAAAADTATKATTASGLDSTGIAQVKGIKVDAATAADTATTATTANKTTGTLTIDVNGTSTAFNGSGNQTININATALGLSGAMNFRGVVSSLPTTGNANGDVVLNGNKEYVWDGDNWVELGDESSHALKSVTISAGDGLTGGGTLEANRTISHADTSSQASVTASGRRYITGVTLDTYGHVTGLTTGTETVTAPTVNNGTLTIQKNGTNVATFGANQSTAATANITVPTKVSELTNDSGFKTTDNNTTYTLTKTDSTITLTGSDGSSTSVADSNTTYSTATTTQAGLMSAADKEKLDGLGGEITSDDLPVVPIAKGGTGATIAKAAEYNISGGMGESDGAITDSNKIIIMHRAASATNGVFVYKKASSLKTYINAMPKTGGTFTGAIYAGRNDQTYSLYLLRNTRLATSDTNPTVNGEICWTIK